MLNILKKILCENTVISAGLIGAKLTIDSTQKQSIRAAAMLAMAFLVEAYNQQLGDFDSNEWTSISFKTLCGLGAAELITRGIDHSVQKIQSTVNVSKKNSNTVSDISKQEFNNLMKSFVQMCEDAKFKDVD